MNGARFERELDAAIGADPALEKALRDVMRRHRRALKRLARGLVVPVAELMRGLDLAGEEIRRLRRRVAALEFTHEERPELHAFAVAALAAHDPSWHH